MQLDIGAYTTVHVVWMSQKDGEGAEQPEAEGSPGSEKDTQSKLPNGDVGTSSGKPDEAPDGSKPDGELSKERTDVDEHTKRMTIISENVYHYVGLVAGREYAREKGLAPKEWDLPVAPQGFLRPEKKKQDAKANARKTLSESRKPPTEETLEADKEVDSPVMQLPRFFQSPSEDKNKATEKSNKSPDASDGKAKERVQEKDNKEKVGKMESKPEKEIDSLEMQLPSFYKSQTTDEEKAPGESGKPTHVSSIKVDNKTKKKGDKERVNKKENVPEKDVNLKQMELPRFYQSDKNKAIAETGKSEVPSMSNGKAEGKTEEKDKKVEKPSKGALESKPEKEVHAPATKIPRFNQLPNEDKKKAGKSVSNDVSNGMLEGKTQEKSEKADKIETADMELPRFYQSPSQDRTKTPGEPDKSETRNVPNGDTKAAKTDQKNDKPEKKSDKETKMQLPRFYSADNNEDKPETESDSTTKRYNTALTVGPRSRKTEEPKRNVAKNFLTVRSTKNDENKAKPVEQDVEELAVQNEEETTYKTANLESMDSGNDPEPNVTQSKSAVKKEKSVRFDDSLVENAAPSIEKKRIISMMYVAPVRSTKNEETICYAAPVKLTSTPPPKSAESRTANDEAYQENDEAYQTNDEAYQENDEAYQENDGAYQHDQISMCGEELLQAGRHSRGLHEDKDDIVNMTYDPEEEKKQPQESDTTDIFNNYGKGPTMNSEHEEPDAVEEIITPRAASSLYSSSTAPRRSHLQRSHDVQEEVPDYDVHHLKQPRSPEVDLGSGKILNAPSILMGSSITLSTNRQKCEVLPKDTPDDGQTVAVIRKTKPAPKEIRIEPLRCVVSHQTGTAVSSQFSFESERASISDEAHASVEPLVMNSPDSVKSLCDSYTQTSDVAREGEKTSAPPVVRSRSVGFQCGPGNPKRSIATLKRPSLPTDSPPAKPLEIEKKTRIPLAARTSHPETKKHAKGSPLPERKITVLRNDTPTTNKISPRTPPATNDPKNHKELVKRRSCPVQNSPGSCLGHPVTTPKAAMTASPRVVRKKDDSPKGSPLHKMTAPSKSMDSIPRCTCLQLTGKDAPHGDKTMSRHPSNPLGLREYGFSPPSKKPHWR